MLLESVYPHKQFAEYLKSEFPSLMPYLTIIRKSKLLISKQNELMAASGRHREHFRLTGSLINASASAAS